MSILILVFAGIWAVPLAAVYLSRVKAGLSKHVSVAIVMSGYVAMSTLTLVWFGLNTTGLIAVLGMVLPFAVAIGVADTIPAGRP